MRRISRTVRGVDPSRSSIPFPKHVPAVSRRAEELPESPEGVLAAFADVSRRIEDLARELKCLGYFDDDDDRPRAA